MKNAVFSFLCNNGYSAVPHRDDRRFSRMPDEASFVVKEMVYSRDHRQNPVVVLEEWIRGDVTVTQVGSSRIQRILESAVGWRAAREVRQPHFVWVGYGDTRYRLAGCPELDDSTVVRLFDSIRADRLVAGGAL